MPSLQLFFITVFNVWFTVEINTIVYWAFTDLLVDTPSPLCPWPTTLQTFHEWRDWNCRTWACSRILIFTEPDNSQCSYFYHPPLENMEATKRNSTAAISCKIALIWDALPPCPLWAAMAVNSWASGPFLNLALLDVWGRHPGHATLLGKWLRTQVCHTKGGEESLFFSVCAPYLNN